MQAPATASARGRRAATKSSSARRGQSREDRERGQRGQQPAPEVTLLRAHVHDEHERPGHEEQGAAQVLAEGHDRAAERRGQRDPPEAPRQHPQVIEEARVVVDAELAETRRRILLLAHVAPELAPRQQRMRIRDHECGDGQPQPRSRLRACAAARKSRSARRKAAATTSGSTTIPAVYFVAAASPRPAPATAQSMRRPRDQHAGAAPRRHGQRQERGHVVQREMRVEDRQERDRYHERREHPHPAVVEARGRQVHEADRGRPQHGRGDPRDHEHGGRVPRERLADLVVLRRTMPRRPRSADTRTPAG